MVWNNNHHVAILGASTWVPNNGFTESLAEATRVALGVPTQNWHLLAVGGTGLSYYSNSELTAALALNGSTLLALTDCGCFANEPLGDGWPTGPNEAADLSYMTPRAVTYRGYLSTLIGHANLGTVMILPGSFSAAYAADGGLVIRQAIQTEVVTALSWPANKLVDMFAIWGSGLTNYSDAEGPPGGPHPNPTGITLGAAALKTTIESLLGISVSIPQKTSLSTVGTKHYSIRRISLSTNVPIVTAFKVPDVSSSLTVNISSFTATDTIGVTGYMVTESAIAPGANDAGWTGSAPSTYTFSSIGVKKLYAWAKNAQNIVSMSRNYPITIKSTRTDLGINIGWATDWVQDRVFADLIRTSRVWMYPGYESGYALVNLPDGYLDAQGWPIRDARLVISNNMILHGTYGLYFTGQASSIYIEGASNSITNISYNAGTNETSATIVINPPSIIVLVIGFGGTQGGVKNVKLMRPTYPGSNISLAKTEILSNEFIAAVEPASTIRYMNYLSTNANLQSVWADRVSGDHATNNVDRSGYLEGVGGSLEDIINISNRLHKDAWINIPSNANDTYIQNVANLFYSGNALTNNAGLDSSLHLYIEFSNEVWNGGYPFLQNGYNHTAAVNEVNAGDAMNLRFDGSTNDWNWADRRVGQKTAQISNIFRSVFGDAAMHTRIRPVLAWQSRFVGGQGLQALVYLEANKTLFPHPVSYYIYGGGGSAYYDPDTTTNPNLTINTLWNLGTMNTSNFLLESNNSVLCSMFGLHRVAYEGGPSMDQTNNTTIDAVLEAAWKDPRMTDTIVNHHHAWNSMGGELLMYFTLTHDYQWGMLENVTDLTHPKYLGIKALEVQDPVAISNIGYTPGTLVGSNLYDYRWNNRNTSSYADDRLMFKQWVDSEWYGTVFNVTVAQQYEAAVVYTGGGIGTLEVLVDGYVVASQSMTGASGTLVGSAVSLSLGLHSVRIKGIGPNGTAVNTDLFEVRTVTLREFI